MSEKRNNSSSSCDASGFATSINIISNETDPICDIVTTNCMETKGDSDNRIIIRSVPSALSLCAMGEKWRNSQLSVHSMMVTDEEKYSYMGSNNSICNGKEEGTCLRKNSLRQYKDNHGLSSTNCIDTNADEVKAKTNIKKDFEDFSNSIVAVPKHSKIVKNKTKKHISSSKTNSTGKSLSPSDDSKATLPDMKSVKKKRRNSIQPGLILDVASLHDTDINSKKKSSKMKSSHTSSEDSGTQNPSSRATGSDNKQRLSPSVLMTPCSPSPSSKSDDGGGSDTSSVYHSTYFIPSEDCKSSDGVLMEIQQDALDKKQNKSSSLAVKNPPRAQSVLGCNDNKESLSPSGNMKSRRPSAVAEDFFRSSLPYIPSDNALPELEKRPLKVSDLNPNEMKDLDTLCMPQWGSVCGGSGPEQKDINDQTCRSNFGIVLSGLCFILFLWYLGMVYSRFIKEALHFDAFDSLLTSAEPETIHEVVINISANDFKLFSN